MATERIYHMILSVLSGEATEEEKNELNDWVSQSVEHASEFEAIRKCYTAFHVQPTLTDPVNVEAAWQKVKSITINKKKRSFVFHSPLLRYAAMLAIVVIAGVYAMTDFSKEEQPVMLADIKVPTLLLENGKRIALKDHSFSMKKEDVTIRNNRLNNILTYQKEDQGNMAEKGQMNHLYIPHGDTYKVELSDGTRVTLNAESELIYPAAFGKEKREVTLKGEGFFEVAKDVMRPFTVNTEQLAVQVLGTTFNICSYANEPIVRATLIEGSVQVSQHGKSQIMTPSEQYIYDKTTGEKSICTVDTEQYTAWVNGEYIFKNATLDEILTRIQHWHSIQINYVNTEAKNLHFSLSITRDVPLDRIIEIINYTNEVKIERTNHIINVKTH